MWFLEALELNQQIQQSQQVSSNSDMFQLPPGIISGMPDNSPFSNLDRNCISDTGTPNSTQPVPSEGFSTNDPKEEATTLNQTPFGQENLEITHTPTWDSKPEKDVFNDTEKTMDMNTQLEFSSMNTDEFEDEPLNPSFMLTKSPRLSKEGFVSDRIDLISSQSENNIVSQFLQNMSMLKQSDPMLCTNNGASLTQKTLQANTILTTVNSNVLMTADTQNHPSPASLESNHKPNSPEHSFLKEALTCPQINLEHPTFNNLQSGRQTQTSFTSKSDTDVTAMDIQVENAVMNSNNLQLDLQMNEKSTETLNAIPQPPTAEHIGDLTSPVSRLPFTSSTPPFSPEKNTQVQQSAPFSPSHVLTSFRLNQVIFCFFVYTYQCLLSKSWDQNVFENYAIAKFV